MTEFQQVILERSQNFIGRKFVFTAMSNFFHRYDRGYFTIVGAPGSGKSAILAKYVTENPDAIYYNVQVAGKNRVDEFVATLCRQIVETRIETRNFESLHSLLQQVSDQLKPQQKFIIAIDALDAIDHTTQTLGSNLFYLPRYLPRGIYFLLSRRPYVRKKSGLLIEAPSQTLDLADYPQQNQEDVQAYILQYLTPVNIPPNPLQSWLTTHHIHPQEFLARLCAKSENNFMYLSQIISAICEGFYTDASRSALDAMFLYPPSLEAYYQQHLQTMIPPNAPKLETELKLSVLKGFLQLSSPVSAEAIAHIIDADEYDVEKVLENWVEFLTLQQLDREIRYSLYHDSFRHFLSKQQERKISGDME